METAQSIGFAPQDRLGVSAFGAVLVHMIVILGVTFTVPKLRELEALPTLEITLVQAQTERAPDNPDMLAQANQDGGGDHDQPKIAQSPLPLRALSQQREVPPLQPAPQRQVTAEREKTDLLTDRDRKKVKAANPEPQPRNLQLDAPNLGLKPKQDQEQVYLTAEISRFWEEYQKRPRRKFLSARTQEYKYAAYMDAWRAKVERIGNLNYPEEAKRRGLKGSLVLDVALKADGTVQNISLRRSSGHKLLDDAAMRIVDLAAPFSPFPQEIRQETDILHITRTWRFNESVLTSEN